MRFSEVNRQYQSIWFSLAACDRVNQQKLQSWAAEAVICALSPDGRNLNWTQNLISFIVKYLN